MSEYYDFTHEDIVKIGVKILKDEGFSDEKIKTEFLFKTPKGKIRIDLVGLNESDEPIFGIECGNIYPNSNYSILEKIYFYNSHLKHFLHLPYNMFKKGKITQYEEKIKFLEEENKKLSQSLFIMVKQLEQYEKILCSIIEGMLDNFKNFEKISFDFMSWVTKFDERTKLKTDNTAWYLQVADRFQKNAIIMEHLSPCRDHKNMSQDLKNVRNKFLKELETQKEIIEKSNIPSSNLLGSQKNENLFFHKDGFHRKKIKFENKKDENKYKTNILETIERIKKINLKDNEDNLR